MRSSCGTSREAVSWLIRAPEIECRVLGDLENLTDLVRMLGVVLP